MISTSSNGNKEAKMCSARTELSQLMETCECSSYTRPAEGDAHTIMELFQIAASEKAVTFSTSNHLQWREVQTVCVPIMCKCVSVIILNFDPLQHTENWKLLPDIHKQWPRKTMQTRCLGSLPRPCAQQLATRPPPPPCRSWTPDVRPRVWVYVTTFPFSTILEPNHPTFKAPSDLSSGSDMVMLGFVRAIMAFWTALQLLRAELKLPAFCTINILRVLFESNIQLTSSFYGSTAHQRIGHKTPRNTLNSNSLYSCM